MHRRVAVLFQLFAAFAAFWLAAPAAQAQSASSMIPAWSLLLENDPPTVSISSPAANAVFNAPANITVTANVADTDDSVTQVQFFANDNAIGTATSAPFTITWSGVGAGNYNLTAIATDSGGAATTSVAVPIIVNAPPTVNITSPASGAAYSAPATITLTASAADTDGSVTQVQFFDGTTSVGTVTTAPYTITLNNVGGGTHSYTAVATDNRGATTTSAVVSVSVTSHPSVSIMAPAANAVFNPPATITVTASAADTGGSITQVQFLANGSSIGTATNSPYTITWSGMASATYNLTAVATDNIGTTATSPAVTIRVNAPPSVTLTTPANGASFTAPATINLTATASDSDGTIAKVDFYRGSTLIATVTSAPYQFSWAGVTAGSYSLSAVATDNDGATTASATATITVNAPQATMFFIHPDHLNTPRLVADANQATVWKWDQQEPFGNDTPNGDPNNTGTTFDLPLRLPGQRYDAETGLQYNYYRDYDPSLGIYKQSDPIGLRGGLNSYAYTFSSPLRFSDPDGQGILGFAVCSAIAAVARYEDLRAIDEALEAANKVFAEIQKLEREKTQCTDANRRLEFDVQIRDMRLQAAKDRARVGALRVKYIGIVAVAGAVCAAIPGF